MVQPKVLLMVQREERVSYGSSISLTSLLAKRPVLLQAIQKAKEIGGVLLVKEVTRLTRSSLVYNYLESTGVELHFFLTHEVEHQHDLYIHT